jgi:hypothetical protein
MKNLFTFALALFVGVGMVSAQSFKLTKNYVVYTTNDSLTSFTNGTIENGGDGDDFADDNQCNIAFSAVGFPYSMGGNGNANLQYLAYKYVDSETGATFPAGYYHVKRTSSQESFVSTDFPAGISNIKKVILYYMIGGQGQYGATYYTSTADADGKYTNTAISNNPNRKMSQYLCPGVSWGTSINRSADLYQKCADGVTDSLDKNGNHVYQPVYNTFLGCDKLFKIAIDFTNATGTDDETSTANYSNVTNNDTAFTFKYQFKDPTGASPVAYSADNGVKFSIKKSGYLAGIAFICNDATSETVFMNVSDGMTAAWSATNKGAYCTPFTAADYYNHYFSDRYYTATGINDVKTNATDNTVKAIFNLQGFQVSEMHHGVNIVKYNDGTTKCILK